MSHFLQFLVTNVTSFLLQPSVLTILAFIYILLFKWYSILPNSNTKIKLTTFTTKATHHWKPSPTWLAASPFTPNLSSAPWPSHAASLWQRTSPCCLVCWCCPRDHEDPRPQLCKPPQIKYVRKIIVQLQRCGFSPLRWVLEANEKHTCATSFK